MGTDIWTTFQARKDGAWVTIDSTYNDRRHYALFAHLAGVRNGAGFAGIVTGDAVAPIAEPRGLPDDFEYDEDAALDGDECGMNWLGDHSQGWLTADEILGHDWTPTVRTGYVTIDAFASLNGSAPDAYCGDITGPNIVKAESADDITDDTTHVRVYWISDPKEYDYFLDEIRHLKEAHGDVRMIFGFDS